MPVVTVEWLEGRSAQQKRRVAQALTRAFADLARVPADQVWIVFRDVRREDWAMGGTLLSDVRVKSSSASRPARSNSPRNPPRRRALL